MMSPQYSVDPRMHRHGARVLARSRSAATAPPATTATFPASPRRWWSRPTTASVSSRSRTTRRSSARTSSPQRCCGRCSAFRIPRRSCRDQTSLPSPHLWPELVGLLRARAGLPHQPAFMADGRRRSPGAREEPPSRHPRAVDDAGAAPRVSSCIPVDHAIRCCSPSSRKDSSCPVAFTRNEPGCIDRVAVGPPANANFYRRSTLRSTRVRGGLVAGWRLGRRPPPMAAAQAPALLVSPRAQLVRGTSPASRPSSLELEVDVPEVVHCSAPSAVLGRLCGFETTAPATTAVGTALLAELSS